MNTRAAWRPLVSVVTISFRDLPGLQRTLPSVRMQRGDFDIEHVVVDGGSGPEVEEFLRDHDDRLVYWQSQPDGGRYDGMNIGTAHCSGDLIWYMHSGDTFADAGAIAAALTSFGSSTREQVRGGWGYGRARLLDASGTPTGEWGYPDYRLRRFAVGDRPIPHQATYFGADLLDRLGGYDVDFGLAADQLFMLRAGMLARPQVLDRIVCDFDTTGVGSVRSPHSHFRDSKRAWAAAGYYPFGHPLAARAATGAAEVMIYARLAAKRLLRR